MPLLTNSGPDMDLTVRRTQFAPSELWSASLKQPKALVKKKVKNQKTNAFGETVGRLHLERQDVDKAAGRRSRVIRRAEAAERREGEDGEDGDNDDYMDDGDEGEAEQEVQGRKRRKR